MRKARILAISDTHFLGRESLNFCRVLESLEFDLLVHAGDFTSRESYELLRELCKERGVELLAVKGNCDKFDLPEVGTAEIYGIKVAAKHEPLMDDFSDLYYLARELEVNVLIFGHIHRFALVSENPLVFCPGAVKNDQFALLEVTPSNFVLKFFKGGEVVDSEIFERSG